jgi:hypothetical protein
MVQIDDSRIGIGILNLECAVLPPGSSSEAIPLDAAVRTIFLFDLKAADSVFHMKVFPVPP